MRRGPMQKPVAIGALIIALLWLAVFVPSSSNSDEPQVDDATRKERFQQRNQLWERATKLRAEGKPAEAIAAGEQVLAIEREFDARLIDDMLLSLDWLGQTELERENFAAAEKRFQELLDKQIVVHGRDHWKVTDARLQLERPKQLAALSPADRRDLRDADRASTSVVSLFESGKFAEAMALAEQCRQIRLRILGTSNRDTAESLNNLAALYDNARDYARAEPLYRQALKIRKQVLGSGHPNYAASLSGLAVLYYKTSDYARAIQLQRQAVEIYKSALGESHPDYATSLNNLAMTYVHVGDYGRAEPLLRQALEIKHPTLGMAHPEYAASLNNLALLYKEMGDFARAEPLYRQALEIRKQALGETHPDYGQSVHNLAALYASMGDLARAEALYRQALEICKPAPGEVRADYATSLNNLATLYAAQHDYARAAPLFRQALEICKTALGETHPDYASSLNNLAELYEAMGNYVGAEQLHRQSLQIRAKVVGESHPDYASGLSNLAVLYATMGNYAAAETWHLQALEIRKKALGETHPDVALCLHNLALVELALGRHAEADRHARLAVAIVRKSLDDTGVVQSERQQLAMLKQARLYLDSFISAALAAGSPPETTYAELAAWKGAVSAQQQLMRARQQVLAADPNSEAGRLFAELEQKTRRLAALYHYTPKPEEAQRFQQSIRELGNSIEALQQNLSRLDPEFHRTWAERKVAPEQLRNSLPADAAVVDVVDYSHFIAPAEPGEKHRWERRYVVFVLRHDRPAACVELGATAPINGLIEVWRAGFGQLPTTDGKLPGDELRRLLWQPIAAAVGEASVVLVSPDSGLARLPWGALPGEAPGTHLLEERAIAIVPVPQRLPEMLVTDTPGADGPLLLVGNVDFGAATGMSDPGQSRTAAQRGPRPTWSALPGTVAEIDEIGKIFVRRSAGVASDKLEQASATEAAVRQAAEKHRYLHLATHGFFAPAPPVAARDPSAALGIGAFAQEEMADTHPDLRSGIVLAGANRPIEVERDDGILTAFEVSELKLGQVDLAVLSACETGLGESAGGEGVLGLQRAFQVAGVRTVVAGLWKVPDRGTQMLMVRFYENLWQKKMPKLAALREAQLWMLREVPKEPELLRNAMRGFELEPVSAPTSSGAPLPPRLWAAFVLSGDWR